MRVTTSERAFIEAQAAISGLTVTEFVRRRALGRRIAPARSATDERRLIELNRIGVNLNQIARSLNSDRPEHHDLSEVIGQLQSELERTAADGS